MKKLKVTKGILFGAALTGSILAVSGCSAEQQPATPKTEVELEDLYSHSGLQRIKPGDVELFEATETTENDLLSGITMVDHHYGHGFTDDKSPIVSTTPIRVDMHVTMHGKGSDVLDNDLACDTLGVDTDRLDVNNVYIGALALSDSSGDKVMVSWPDRTNGQIGENIYVCSAEEVEPEHGVVLFIDDQPS